MGPSCACAEGESPSPSWRGRVAGLRAPELVLGEVGGGEDLPLPGDQGASWPEGL